MPVWQLNSNIWQNYMNLIFDLDGTLICSRERLYRLFLDITGIRSLSYEDYWGHKFNKLSNQKILTSFYGWSDEQTKSFTDEWMSNIEDDTYLALDTPIPGVHRFLDRARELGVLSLCTARQSKSQLAKQLLSLNLSHYFDNILVTEQKLTKVDLISSFVENLNSSDWLVGDTGHDINTAKELGIKSCAVLTGFMLEENLVTYEPDLIISDVTEFKDVVG